ncbi:MAG: GntR family transcriptional regulator [Gemmobacter sp.]|nr:GntR family transcriptional regulator [Gemmobacter sp.]
MANRKGVPMYQGKEAVPGPAAEICERIWLSIAERRLRPGTRLKEEQLAEVFDVSRARVRQALAMLESDGLVTILPNRGAFVSEPGVDEARDVFHFRRQVEARVVERLSSNISEDALPRLEAHLALEREADARGDTTATIRLSGGFHMLLAELAGSTFLTSMLRDLISRSTLITTMYRRHSHHNCGPDEHAALIDRIRARDLAGALEAMEQHLRHVENELDLTEDVPVLRDLRDALV